MDKTVNLLIPHISPSLTYLSLPRLEMEYNSQSIPTPSESLLSPHFSPARQLERGDLLLVGKPNVICLLFCPHSTTVVVGSWL